MSGPEQQQRTPIWFVVVVIVALLPVFQFPALLSLCPQGDESVKLMIWIYPVYEAVAGWLAWRVWPARRELSWILVVLMVLTHCAAWMLVGA